MTPQGYPLFAVVDDLLYAVVGWEYDQHGTWRPLVVPIMGDTGEAAIVDGAVVFASFDAALAFTE